MASSGSSQRAIDVQLEKFLLDLSERLGNTWKDVGRRLGLQEATLENIQEDYKKQKEMGYQMLLSWKQEQGCIDMDQRLDNGLRKAGRADLADDFVPRLRGILSSMKIQRELPLQTEKVIKALRSLYERKSKLPLVPWVGAGDKKRVTRVSLDQVFTNLELLIDVETPDLPIRYPLKKEDVLFEELIEGVAPRSNRVVIRGRTGSGKTTLMLKMGYDWARKLNGLQGEAKLVFLLPMRKLDHRSNIGEAIIEHLLPRKTSITAKDVEDIIARNEEGVVFLLDGYDEFKGKGLAQEDCGNLVKMLRNECFEDVRVLITTRPGRVKDFWELAKCDEYRHLEVTGFTSSDIDKYVRKIFKDRQELGKKLLIYLEENHLKNELASLPLMLCAFCQLAKFTNGKDFKDMNTISCLFDKLLKCLLFYHPLSKDEKNAKMNGVNKEGHDELIIQLGLVALDGFLRSTQEELIFSQDDFKRCRPSGNDIVQNGCAAGILFIDGEAEFRPTTFEDLDINREDDTISIRNISFVLKILQEKCAGKYLAHLFHGSKEEQTLFKDYLNDISTVQRAIDVGNVLMFACGASIHAARDIIHHVTSLVCESEADNIQKFMSGKLNFKDSQRVQRLIEFCLQLNYESQGKGQLNDVLQLLLPECPKVRLVGISSYVTKCLGYLLQYSEGLNIKSLELIRLSLNSSTDFREFLNTFPGLEDHISQKINDKKQDQVREKVSQTADFSQYLRQRGDDVFFAVAPLWQQIVKMQRSEWNFGPVVDGLQNCLIEVLILHGMKAGDEDWRKLFSLIANPSFNALQKLTLSMNGLSDDLLAGLAALLHMQENLKYIKLSGNQIGLKFMSSLCLLPNLQTLILDKTDLTKEAFTLLAGKLDCFPELKTLDVRRNKATDDDVLHAMCDNLHHCSHLEDLRLSLYLVTQDGLMYLAAKESALANLRELHLVHTPIPDSVLQCVAELLPHMSQLRDLRISGTPIEKSQPASATGVASAATVAKVSEGLMKAGSLEFFSLLYITMDADSFLLLLSTCTKAHRDMSLKTLRFSNSCLPGEKKVLEPREAAEKTFLRIWV